MSYPATPADILGGANWWVVRHGQIFPARNLESRDIPETDPEIIALEFFTPYANEIDVADAFRKFAQGEASPISQVGTWDTEGSVAYVFRWSDDASGSTKLDEWTYEGFLQEIEAVGTSHNGSMV